MELNVISIHFFAVFYPLSFAPSNPFVLMLHDRRLNPVEVNGTVKSYASLLIILM